MYDSWPFFRAFVDLVELELAKADPAVSALYDDKTAKAKELAPTPRARRRRPRRARRGDDDLPRDRRQAGAARRPAEDQGGVRRARAELDALHAIQAEAMGRLKTEGAPADGTDAHRQLSDALIITVQGSQPGMKQHGLSGGGGVDRWRRRTMCKALQRR